LYDWIFGPLDRTGCCLASSVVNEAMFAKGFKNGSFVLITLQDSKKMLSDHRGNVFWNEEKMPVGRESTSGITLDFD